MARPTDKQSPADNFLKWKVAVGLPETFPKLLPLSDADLHFARKFYAGPNHASMIDEILTRAASHLVWVNINKGLGCTTLSRYVSRRLREETLTRMQIPVRLALDEVSNENLVAKPFALLEQVVRRDILRSVVDDKWHYVLDPAQYAELIGAVDSPTSQLEPQRLVLKSVLGRSTDLLDLDGLAKTSPTLATTVDVLLEKLWKSYGIRVSLQVDLSSDVAYQDPDRYEDLVRGVQRAVKKLHEDDQRKPQPTLPSVLAEMYFGHPQSFDIYSDHWSRSYVHVTFPPYLELDVFAMLAYHYPPSADKIGNERIEALSAVMDSRLLDHANDGVLSLNQIVEEFTKIAVPTVFATPPHYQIKGSTKGRDFK